MKTMKKVSRTRLEDPKEFAQLFDKIGQEANQLLSKTEFTERDVYVACDLSQRYIELLDILESIPLCVENNVVVKTDGQSIKFPNIEAVSSWLKL